MCGAGWFCALLDAPRCAGSSWHDDGVLKYRALNEWAESFRLKHCREPSIWLDVRSDGLKPPLGEGIRRNPAQLTPTSLAVADCRAAGSYRPFCIASADPPCATGGRKLALTRTILTGRLHASPCSWRVAGHRRSRLDSKRPPNQNIEQSQPQNRC